MTTSRFCKSSDEARGYTKPTQVARAIASAAVNDISIANRLNVFSETPAWAIPQPGVALKGRTLTIIGIEQLLS
jgi:hypothetical protein